MPEQGEALNVPSGMHSAPLCCLAAGRRGPSPCHLHPTASVTLPGAGGGGRESEMWQGESGKRKERRKPDVGESIRRGGRGAPAADPAAAPSWSLLPPPSLRGHLPSPQGQPDPPKCSLKPSCTAPHKELSSPESCVPLSACPCPCPCLVLKQGDEEGSPRGGFRYPSNPALLDSGASH